MSSSFVPVNPAPYLSSLIGNMVCVKLKWGMSYYGYLLSLDSYMNLQLGQTVEFINNKPAGQLGEILIRCNNILYCRGVQEKEEQIINNNNNNSNGTTK